MRERHLGKWCYKLCPFTTWKYTSNTFLKWLCFAFASQHHFVSPFTKTSLTCQLDLWFGLSWNLCCWEGFCMLHITQLQKRSWKRYAQYHEMLLCLVLKLLTSRLTLATLYFMAYLLLWSFCFSKTLKSNIFYSWCLTFKLCKKNAQEKLCWFIIQLI